MRVFVIGASGYIGSRVIPALVDKGHTVIAGARDPDSLARFPWHDDALATAIDVVDDTSVHDAFEAHEVDAVLYLVHGMGGDDFRANDLAAAQRVAASIDRHRIPTVVYVSGIIPPVPEDELSEHLLSRLEVEQTLTASTARAITLRAAMVLGSGSTSFEIMAQLAERLPVTVVPDWMNSSVEPIAVVDLCAAIVGALESEVPSRHYDIGGGRVLAYPELIDLYTEAKGITRPQLDVPLLPQALVSKVASWIADVPSSTVTALMDSLQEDMVAADRDWLRDLVGPDFQVMSVEDALHYSLHEAPASEDEAALNHQPGDPEWSSEQAPGENGGDDENIVAEVAP